jgi:hypothetical protein
MLYNVAQPEAQQNGAPNITVDFNLSFQSLKLLLGSVRLGGKLKTNNAGAINEATNLFYDSLLGIDNFIQSIRTSFNGRTIEYIDHYPRYVRMESDAMKNPTDTMNSEDYAALKLPFKQRTNVVLRGFDIVGNVGSADFYGRPNFCLNKPDPLGSSLLSFQQSGTVRVSFTFTEALRAYFGGDANAALTYAIENLRIYYQTIPDDGKVERVVLKTKYGIPQEVRSASASIDTNVPGMLVRSISMSFIRADRESSFNYNSWATEPLPNINRVQFLFNDTSNNRITYPLDTREEILHNYVKSFRDTGVNNLLSWKMADNESYGVGMDFGAAMDFTNQKLSVVIDSGVNSTQPYMCYIYAHGFIEV